MNSSNRAESASASASAAGNERANASAGATEKRQTGSKKDGGKQSTAKKSKNDKNFKSPRPPTINQVSSAKEKRKSSASNRKTIGERENSEKRMDPEVQHTKQSWSERGDPIRDSSQQSANQPKGSIGKGKSLVNGESSSEKKLDVKNTDINLKSDTSAAKEGPRAESSHNVLIGKQKIAVNPLLSTEKEEQKRSEQDRDEVDRDDLSDD